MPFWPAFLAKEFWYLKEVSSYREAYDLLLEKPLSHVVAFFLDSIEDETWIKESDGELLAWLFAYFSELMWAKKISDSDLNQIVRAVQIHSHVLAHRLPKDLDFIIQNETFTVSSLMFMVQSGEIRERIIQAWTSGRRTQIPILDVSRRMFIFLLEFVYTSRVENLWKEEPSEILEVIRLANGLEMASFANFAADIYKRYISLDNVTEQISLAEKEGLSSLVSSCCHFLSERFRGLRADFIPGEGLTIELRELDDDLYKILQEVSSSITSLSLREKATQQEEAILLTLSLPNLKNLDLSETEAIDPRLIDEFPSLSRVDLRSCPWLEDSHLIQIIERAPRLMILDLSGNTQLTLRSWGALSTVSSLLDLDLSYCTQIDDDELDLIASGCPQLVVFSLTGCTALTDLGIMRMSRQCTGLKKLSLARLPNITNRALSEVLANCTILDELDINHSDAITTVMQKQLALRFKA